MLRAIFWSCAMGALGLLSVTGLLGLVNLAVHWPSLKPVAASTVTLGLLMLVATLCLLALVVGAWERGRRLRLRPTVKGRL